MDAVRDRGADVSIDDLATHVGVSKPVLYSEFGDKKGIADAIAVHLAEGIEREVMATIDIRPGFDIESGIRVVIGSLVDLVVSEPELYAFIVRSIRISDRGLLDNALVRAIHQRARLLVAMIAPGASNELVQVLSDGLFGFVFGSIESWYETRPTDRDVLVEALTVVIRNGIQAVTDDLA